jgi:hypothetical protein
MLNLSSLNLTVFLSITITFGLLIALSRLKSPSQNLLENLLMGRRLSTPALAITLVSSWYCGILGATQIAYKNGIYNFIVLGVFWYLAAVIFAMTLSSKIFRSGSMSLPELVGRAYGKGAEKMLLYLMLIKTMPINYIMAFCIIITFLFKIPEPMAWCVTVIIAISMLLRTSLRNVMLIDYIQFITIFSTLFWVCYYSAMQLGGISELFAQLPASHTSVTGNSDYSKMILWFMVALSTTILSPIFHQRCAASNSGKTARRGILFSLIFWFVSDALTTLGGLYAFAKFGPGYDEHAFMHLMMAVMPDGLLGYALAALLITAFSALDTHIFASKSLVLSSCHHLPKNFQYALSIGIIIASAIIGIFLQGDLEKAWLLFDSAFISSLMIPAIVAIRNPHILTSKQFRTIIIACFTTAVFSEYLMLSRGASSCLWILCLNAVLVVSCHFYNRCVAR